MPIDPSTWRSIPLSARLFLWLLRRWRPKPRPLKYNSFQGNTLSDVTYVSKVRVERKMGPLRIAYLPGESQPVTFSVHGAVAEHYKIDPGALKESHASTLGYVIAASAGGMMGTFGSALEARQINASNGRLTADVNGEVETEEGVLVIRRIHVAMRLAAAEDVTQDRARARNVRYALSSVSHPAQSHSTYLFLDS